MPLPPPPAAALIATGNPCSAAKASTCSAEVNGSRVPGTPWTPAASAASLDSILSPIIAIADAGGPTQVNPASTTACANSAFSARNPYPGCTAEAFDSLAISRIFGMFR